MLPEWNIRNIIRVHGQVHSNTDQEDYTGVARNLLRYVHTSGTNTVVYAIYLVACRRFIAYMAYRYKAYAYNWTYNY